MARDDVEIDVGAKWTGDAALRRAAAAVDKVAMTMGNPNAIATAKRSWTELNSALDVAGRAYNKVAAVAGMAYSALREGAALITTQQRFEKLAESIGTTSDSLMNRLRPATQGLMTDAELMASASQIMSLRLADNADQVTRLATVSGTLGWDMQQVILTFSNLSTMRLDALGLSVDEVKNKQKQLEEQGYSTAEAFKEAVIQAGETRLGVGALSEIEKQLRQVEVAAKEAADAFKVGFAEGASESIGTVLTQLQDLGVSTEEVAGEVGRRAGAALSKQLTTAGMAFIIDDIEAQLGELLGSEEAASEAIAEITRQQNRAGIAAHGLVDGLTSVDVALENQAAIVERAAGLVDQLTMATQLSGDAWQVYYTDVAQDAQIAAAETEEAAGRMISAMGQAFAFASGYGNPQGWMGGRFGTNRPTPLGPERRAGGPTRDRGMMDWASDQTAYDYEYIEEEASALRSYGGAMSYVSEEAQKAAEARQRFVSTFNEELRGKPEDGLINAEGVVNVEAMNSALYRQVEAAGASAATLALLGIATGQFSEEQAEAALKAAILQEQINKIAESVVSGKITLEQALASLGEAQANINQADLITVAGAAAAIPESERTVAVEADTSGAEAAVTNVQTSLAVLTDEPYLATLDMDIQAVLLGTQEASQALDAVPDIKTVTINWAQAGVDVITALRALGVMP